MSHEESVTIQDRKTKQWVNLSSKLNRKKLNQRQIEDMYYSGKSKPLGGKVYKTLPEAEEAAINRSKSFNKVVEKYTNPNYLKTRSRSKFLEPKKVK